MKKTNYFRRIASKGLLGNVEPKIAKTNAGSTSKDEEKRLQELDLIAKAIALLPHTNSVLKDMKAEDVVNLIAKQAQNMQEDGSLSYLQTPEAAYDSAVRNFDKQLVDAAIKALKGC